MSFLARPAVPTTRRGVLLGAGLAALTGCGTRATSTSTSSSSTSSAVATPTPSPSPTPQLLPRGGRTIFPTHRLVGWCGQPDAPGQGRLGIGDLDSQVAAMEAQGRKYAAGRTVLPVMELIVTTVQGSPGKDGMWRVRCDDAVIQTWLEAARRHKAYLLLNVQPGRSDFLDELKHLEKWLLNPDVGVALDPEWSMGPGEVPMHVLGHTTGAKLDECAAYLADLVERHDLPEKVMVYHQLAPRVVRQESGLRTHKGVALVKCVDGIGSPYAKLDTWKLLLKTIPTGVHPGFKLFFQEDVQQGGRLMTAKEILAMKPLPEYILFE